LVAEVIQPLIEAEHYYQSEWDSDWNKRGGIMGREYILILSLAYITEVKCYLELEEHEMALKRLAEAEETVRPRIKSYVKHLLTKNPSGYLHLACKGVNLSDILEILKYITGELDTDKLFDQYLRKSIFNCKDIESWIESIPVGSRNAALAHIKPSLVGKDWDFWAYLPWNTSARKEAIFELLSQTYKVIEVIHSMIELDRRLEGYRYEISEMSRLGLSYQEWKKLVLPPENLDNNSNSKVLLLLPGHDLPT